MSTTLHKLIIYEGRNIEARIDEKLKEFGATIDNIISITITPGMALDRYTIWYKKEGGRHG